MTQLQKVLVTGGTGLVGSHLLYKLVTDGFQVRAICRNKDQLTACRELFLFYSPNGSDLFEKIEWAVGDVTDYFSILDALEGVDCVYHSAAFVTFDPRKKSEMFRINEEGSANVVNACLEKGVQKLCYVSSIATLGSSVNGNLIDEESLWQSDESHSSYSKSKFLAEMQVWRASKEGLNVVMVNPGVIIGPGDLSRSSGALIGRIKRGMKFYTNGVTGYVDVRDVANAMVLLMTNDVSDNRFVLVSENLSYRQFLETAATALGSEVPRFAAGPVLTGIAWRLDAFVSFLLRRAPGFTRENARTSHNRSHYTSQKFINQFQYKFCTINESINNVNNWLQSVSQ
jgi:nucleoside-diphosphate-sugar epimerase